MTMNNFLLSIIIPCFNEEENVFVIIKEIKKALLCDYEIILINDGSTDQTQQNIELLASKHKEVNYISFSRNFGHQAALKAGIDHAQGDCILTMDADLQQPIAEIPRMILLWQEGFDIVTAVRRTSGQSSFFKKKSSKYFYWFLSKIADHEIVIGGPDFRLFDKRIADIIRNIPEQHLYLRGLFSWLGFRHTTLEFCEDPRRYGKTKYNVRKMLQLAVNGITSCSVKPLRAALSIGVFFALLAFSYGVYAIIVLLLGLTVSGWTSIIAGIMFLSGIQLMVLGIIGEYIGKLYIENKRRPNYIVADTNLWKEKIVNTKTERRAVMT